MIYTTNQISTGTLRWMSAFLLFVSTSVISGCIVAEKAGQPSIRRLPLETAATSQRLPEYVPLAEPDRLEDHAVDTLPTVTKQANDIQLVGYFAAEPPMPGSETAPATIAVPNEVQPNPEGDNAMVVPLNSRGIEFQENTHPIDLANALGLGGASHLQIQMARERVVQAQAKLVHARASWLPSLRFGVGWNKHDGRIQPTEGDIREVSRNSLFFGGGAGLGWAPLAGGAGGPSRMMVNLSVADAFFGPKVAQNLHASAAQDSRAVFNDSLLQIANRYMDMLEVHGRLANSRVSLSALNDMVELTSVFEESGEATQTEVNRARTQQSLQERILANLERQTKVTSAELARLLRLDPALVLVPAEVQIAPIEIVDASTPIADLLATGLATRPELDRQQAMIWAAGQRVSQEHWRPWLPNVQIGASGGNFGGGTGSNYDDAGGRSDVDVLAYWELQNLGYGNRALRQQTSSEQREACLRSQWIRDQIEAEIVATASDVLGYQEQIGIAQQAAESARETYRLNKLKIREGEGLPLELLQAITSLGQSLDAYVAAVNDYNRAQFRLLRAMGRPPQVAE